MSLGLWLGVALFGAVGAVARYLLDVKVSEATEARFPYGTLTVNVLGSFVLGLVSGVVLFHAAPSAPKVLVGTGLCGSFTTFSTFALETVLLATGGERRAAALNVGVSLLAGCGAAALGLLLAAA